MTLIRDIASAEVPLLLDGARTFWTEGKLPGTLNPASFVTGWRNLLANGAGLLIGAFDQGELLGAIGGAMVPDFQTGDLVSQEFFWYVIPGVRGAGLKLLQQFERRMKERGAARNIMMHLTELNGEAMEKVYKRMDYVLKEKIYIKEL